MKLLKPLALAGLGLGVSISSFAELEEIIVTATKREASVQDIPIAVTALSGEAISKAGINDIRDLTSLSSSFQSNSSNSETGGTTLRVRGVGTTGNNIGLESAVGVFLDGVYLSRPAVALGDLVDIERVEILRGPQGTLFGRNTSAGALNIITKKASLNESAFWANAGFGNYDARNFQVGGTIPLIEDELGFRFSATKRDQDGFAESLTSGTQSVTRDRYSLRSELLWAPNDDMEVRFIADYAETDEQCCDATVLLEGPFAGKVYGAAGLNPNGGVLRSGSDALQDLDTNGGGLSTETEQFGLSAQLDWDLGFADLTALVSYREYESMGANDADFTGLDVFRIGTDFGVDGKTEIDTWTAEVRLQGSTDRLDWMVGAYYSDEDIDVIAPFQLGDDFTRYISAASVLPALLGKIATPELAGAYLAEHGATVVAQDPNGDNAVTVANLAGLIQTGGDTVAALYGPNGDPAGKGAINSFKQQAQSWSVYTHNTFAINEQLDLVFGLRWINEEKDGQVAQPFVNNPSCGAGATRIQINADTIAAGLANISASGKPGGALPGALGLGCFFPAAPFGLLTTAGYDTDFHDEELTYTAKIVYQVNENSSAYVSYTHGFKAGGFNLDPTAASGGADPRFDSETTDAWEIGYKADLFDNRLRANIALFHQELEDFQVLEFNGVQFVTFNVDKVISSGIETEFLLSTFDDLDLSLAITYTDARYPNSCDGGVFNSTVTRLCGQDLTNAPNLVSVFGATYNTLIPGTELAFFANGSIRYESERRTGTQAVTATGAPSARDIQSGNSKMNLRMGVASVDGKWTVELWGNNITDKQTRNVTFDVPLRGARGAFFDAPRTYGLTLRTEF